MSLQQRTLKARLVGAAQLVEPDPSDGQTPFQLAPGNSVVLVATDRRPRRFLTYDTGATDTLMVDLGPGFDPTQPPDRITRWRAIGFSVVGMRPTYVAREADGDISFAMTRSSWLGLGEPQVEILVKLGFTPTLDRSRVGRLTIDWRLTAPAKLQADALARRSP
ncbi:hypothetical protein [Caulobacter sp.]|uniref:hypothetical protein n=1 Tax=Caulobacter sp. TaxID=78 RepID=UPI001B1E9FA3|nr:hypothetical protein [Caulobacter sp.]MBO9545436.1 hypothetical protein [Caulobacter sp.]